MNKAEKIASIIAVILIILVVGGIALFNYSHRNRMLPNIFINGESYENLTFDEAKNMLEGKTKDAVGDGIKFSYKDKIYTAQPADIGLTIDIDKPVKEAYGYGHNKDILGILKDDFHLVANRLDLWIDMKIDENTFNEYLSQKIAKLEDPPSNFTYEYTDSGFVPVRANTGMVLDRPSLKHSILNNFSKFKNETINIELVKMEPEVTEDAGNVALSHAKNIIKGKLILKYNTSKWALQEEDIGSFIKFDPIMENASGTFKKVLEVAADSDNITRYLETLTPQINQDPINAELESKGGKVQVFSLDHDGIALNTEKSADEIAKAFFVPDNYLGVSKKSIEIDLVVENVEPQITIENIDNMGITALLSTGESDFSGSPKNRRHNIGVGASKFQGILVGPGDEFSFVKILGEVGPKEGYLPELVIKKGETVPEYGGGLCQVSSTAFRGAVQAGLEITERQNHAYPVKYYNPQGTDA
ncbi:MAG: VanW family protein, partial [Smithella sp.]|nr:VanW family protein [Smithella sp.]